MEEEKVEYEEVGDKEVEKVTAVEREEDLVKVKREGKEEEE